MHAIESVDAPALSQDTAWWTLYEASFPPSEQEPRSVILTSLDSGRALAVRSVDEDRSVGLGVAYLLKAIPFVFVAYLAVDASWRKHGLGSRLLATMGDLGAERLAREGLVCQGTVMEVDDPALAGTPEERRIRERRIRFFEAQGARPLDVPYLQPAIDGETVVPMRLMVIDRVPGTPFPARASRDLIRAMYAEKYGPTNGIESAILEALLPSPNDAPAVRSPE